MIVLVVGSAAEAPEYAERLRNHLSYLGNACITYNYREPAEQMHDGALLALQQYSNLLKIPRVDVFEGPKDESLLALAEAWLEKNMPLHTVADARLKSMTGRWEELKMNYVAIVFGNMKKEDVERFPESFRVLLGCSSQNSGPSQLHFKDCALSNIFDCVVDTSKVNADEAAAFINASLRDKLASALKKVSDNSL